MNITTKLIIPGVALLYSISVANAAHRPQHIPAVEVTAIAEKYGYDENFVRNSYEKFMALYHGNLGELANLFPDGTGINELMLDFSTAPIGNLLINGELGIANNNMLTTMNTPLAIACNRNNAKSVKWLLDNGADANQIVSDKEGINVGRKLLEIECIDGRAYTAELLVQHEAELTEEAITYLKKLNADHLKNITELYDEEKQKGEVGEFRIKNIEARQRIDSLLNNLLNKLSVEKKENKE